MTPEQLQLLQETNMLAKDNAKQIQDLTRIVTEFLEMYYHTNFIDKMILNKELVINGKLTFGRNSTFDMSGLSLIKLGGVSSQIGMYGVTPIGQQGAISAPTGGATVDSQSRAAISSIINALHNIGIVA